MPQSPKPKVEEAVIKAAEAIPPEDVSRACGDRAAAKARVPVREKDEGPMVSRVNSGILNKDQIRLNPPGLHQRRG